MSLPAPVRHMRFRHQRILDNEALARGERIGARCLITFVRRGVFFYAVTEPDGSYSKAKDSFGLDDWPRICAEVLPAKRT